VNRKKHVGVLLVAFFLVLSIAFTIQYVESPRKPLKVTEASYIVFTDGGTVYASNGWTERIEYSGTDASLVIQAALDSLGSEGGMILIKEGTYVVSNTIRVPGDVTLSGVGYASKLVLADYADKEIIENKNGDAYVDSNIVIRDLQIDGNGGMQTHEAQVSAIVLTNVTNSRVEGCWIHNVAQLGTNAAIYVLHSSNVTIRGNMIYDNRYAGIFLRKGTNAIISNNWFYHNHRAVYLIDHNYGIVEGNQIVSGDEGVRMYGDASYNLIEGNFFKDNHEEAVAVIHAECEGNFVTGNYMVGNVVHVWDDGTGTVVRNNEGYRTENRGMASVVNGTYIPHGLASTPTSVQLTPTAPRIVASVNKNSTHIEVGLWFLDGSAVTEPEDVYWYVEV